MNLRNIFHYFSSINSSQEILKNEEKKEPVVEQIKKKLETLEDKNNL